VHGLGSRTDAAGIGQSQKQSQLTVGDMHRFLSMVMYLKIDFTLLIRCPTIPAYAKSS
jgi:hypothetical protein